MDMVGGCYGDWGRDVALVLGRREWGLKLEESGRLCGGLDYRTVGTAVKKIIAQLEKDPELAKSHESVRRSSGIP